jgi:signal transduction histidine kinase
VKHLTTRVVILLMLALMLITGAFDYVRLTRERDRMVEQTKEDERIFVGTLALAVGRNIRRGRTTEELKELLDEILKRPGLVWVAIYDPEGSLATASVVTGIPPSAADDRIASVLRTRTEAADVIDTGAGQHLRQVQPVRWSDGRTAAIEVRQSLEGFERTFARELREEILFRLVVLVFFVFSIVAVTRWSITRPIRALVRGARAVGGGDLSQRIPVKRPDEIGQLADEFNRMAENLAQAHDALLRQSDERLRMEQELHQAQKLAAVGMLAAEVAHEVGTPLNVISGRAEALARIIPQEHPGRRHLDVVLGQTERITAIIRALLDYTRPRRPALREEAVLPLLARVIDLLRGRFRAKEVRIALEFPSTPLPRVLADPDQLQQVFLNVIANALDASTARGTVRVTSGPEPLLPGEGRAGIVRGKVETPCLAIHVLDDGPGLTADQLAHVFEPFFSTKKRGQGTGLGLPIVEEIVRAHRGEVEMLSVPGRGTEVIVRLPLADEGVPTALPAAMAGARVPHVP